MKRPLYRSQPLINFDADPADLPPQPLSPTGGPLAPEPKYPPRHPWECCCDSCLDRVAAMDRYLDAKRAYDLNGF